MAPCMKRMMPSYSAIVSSTPEAPSSAWARYVSILLLLAVLICVVSSDGAVHLVDFLNLFRNRLENFISRIQFRGQAGLLCRDQCFLLRDIVVQGSIFAAVFAERKADRASVGAAVAETVQRIREGRTKSAGVLKQRYNLGKVAVQCAAQRVG